MKIQDLPDFAKPYKTKGYDVKLSKNSYQLFRITSVRIEGKKFPQPQATYIGTIDPIKGLIPKKIETKQQYPIDTVEFGLSDFVIRHFKHQVSRSIYNCSRKLFYMGVIYFLYGHIEERFVRLSYVQRYLEEGDADPATLHAPITKALREGHIIPVCFTSAKKLIGIRDFMKVIIRHLPSPAEANDAQFIDKDGNPFVTTPDSSKPVIAHVFKVVSDPFVGKIGVFRVHQGRITPGSTLYVNDNKKPIKVARPLLLQGKNASETDELHPGDIGALNKIDELTYGCILHSDPADDGIRMRPLPFPKPMFGLAIAPARRGDEGRMSEVLNKMLAEDPTLSVDHDVVLNETVLRGLTEMHVRTVLERMKDQFKLEVVTSNPSVPYRETIGASAEGHARHKKQTGGAGQFGEVYLRVEPLPRGSGFEFVDQVKGGVIPYNLIPAVEKGVREVLATGYVAGYPIEDIRVVVYDGKSHPVDSKEVAFVAAGRKAMLDALAKASPQVLEPIVSILITAPDNFMGDITGDLASRRGQIVGTDNLPGGLMEIRATAPLSELDGYATRLHALTQGAGAFTMDLAGYQPVPAQKQAELASKFSRKAEED